MKKFFTWVGGGIVVIAVIILLGLAGRVIFYRQADDPVHVAAKRDYLERIATLQGDTSERPNIVLILFDDLGPGDVGAYGGRSIRTPAMDRLASRGVLFRNAYAPSPYCSASRAGLLTGRSGVRAGLDHVLQAPGSGYDLLLKVGGLNRRLPAEEVTLPEVLSAAGYATAIFGKWHLGMSPPSRPTDRGFDTFYGLLTSNDQGRPEVWQDLEVVERHPIDQSTLTRRYTERAVAFIEAHPDRPFFLYLPHTFPHVPLHAAADRLGRSPGGLYGDVVEELDDSVGAVVDALDRAGVAERTLIVLTSDNGPWYQGSTGGLRGRKMDIFEGGMRVPFVVCWPDRIPSGVIQDQPIVGIDVFPTVLELARLPLPEDRVIEGRSLVDLLAGDVDAPSHPVYFHQISTLRAVRLGRFKYHDRHRVLLGNPADFAWAPMTLRGPWLFDLELDPAESYDVSHAHPEEARRLRELLEARQRELADNPRGWR